MAQELRTARYWVAAIAFGQIAATVVKLVLQRPRPLADLYDGLSTYAFPSGHATMSMVAYGFLATLIAGQFDRPHRWMVYAVATLLISVIAASRLYLSAHWLSDVIGGLSLGLTWVCLLAIAYHRHPVSAPPPRGLLGVGLLAFTLAADGT
ncbi:MAG: phosphatase PAP2 family protein [Pseudomonadota bacterium]